MVLLLVVGVLIVRVRGPYLSLEHCRKIKLSIYICSSDTRTQSVNNAMLK